MHSFPGTNPLTINSVGTGSPGVVVNTGAHGVFTVPQVVDGGDSRSAANFGVGHESLMDSVVWIGWRVPDWITGGDYRSLFQGTVQVANIFAIDRSSIHGGGVTTLTLFGDADGGTALLAQATSANGNGALTQGNGTGYGLQANGGGSQSGAKATAGSGSNKNGIEGTGDGSTQYSTNGSFGGKFNGGIFVFNGPVFRSGSAAISVLREGGLPFAVDSSNSFDPSTIDVLTINAPTTTSTRTWTLDHPASGVACLFYFNPTGSGASISGNLLINDASTGNLVTITSGGGNWGAPYLFLFSPTAATWRAMLLA
jgi:hypothetical protein